MKTPTLFRSCFALLLLFVVPFGVLADDVAEAGSEPVIEADHDLMSPREVFRTFLTAMTAYGDGQEFALKRATKCLNLSGLPPHVREARGAELAFQLLGIINRIRVVNFSKIPGESATRPYVFYESEEGSVIVKKYGPNWMFAGETVQAVSGLYRALEEKPLVRGITSDIAPLTLAGKIRAQLPKSLQGDFFLLEIWQWLGIVLALFAVWLVKWFSTFISRIFLTRLAQKVSFLPSAKNLEDIAQPLSYFLVAIVAQFGVDLLDLPLRLYSWTSLFLGFVRLVAILFVVYRCIDLVAEFLLIRARNTRTRADDLLIPLFQKIGRVAVFIVGAILLAGLFDFNVAGLVAGLGLGGLAFALAAKDTVENLFGSVTVLLDQPFSVGDYVSVGGMEGTVEHIGLRSTRIRTPLNSLITMPNSTLIATSVENLGARKYRRTRMMLGLTYGTPVEKIEEFMQEVRNLIEADPNTRKDYYHVEFNEFGDSSLNVLLNVYFSVMDYSEELACRRELLLNILRVAEKVGVEFAFPSRTIYMAESEEAA